MQLTPFTIFTKTDLAAIQSSLEQFLSIWSEKWFISTVSLPSVEVIANAFEKDLGAPQSSSRIARNSSGATCQILYSGRTLNTLYLRTTGDHLTRVAHKLQADSIETVFLTKTLDDFMALILNGQSSTRPASPPLQEELLDETLQATFSLHKGSGVVVVKIKDQESVFYLYLSQSLARRLSGKSKAVVAPAKLVPRKAAIGRGKLKIEVVAGDAELRLSDLLDLKPGNVVRLNMKPDQPFLVQTENSHYKISAGFLGTYEGHKAIELINQ